MPVIEGSDGTILRSQKRKVIKFKMLKPFEKSLKMPPHTQGAIIHECIKNESRANIAGIQTWSVLGITKSVYFFLEPCRKEMNANEM